MAKDLFEGNEVEVSVSTMFQHGYYIELSHKDSASGMRLEFRTREDVLEVVQALKGKEVRFTTGDLSQQHLIRNGTQFVYVE